MRRYITIRAKSVGRAYIDDGEYAYYSSSQADTITVFEKECIARETGLIDQYGNSLYALEERLPIGFTQNYLR